MVGPKGMNLIARKFGLRQFAREHDGAPRRIHFHGMAEGFRSNFLSDLSEGGVRINTALEVGQHILLNISFLGFVAPVQIEAIVQWSQPATDPEGAASGLMRSGEGGSWQMRSSLAI